MLPTKYSGAVVVEGERKPAELHLESEEAVLTLVPDDEAYRWPLRDLTVEAIDKGEYRFRHAGQDFLFLPSVDDGLAEEIALRRRLQQPSTEAPAAAIGATIADRVSAAGRHAHVDRLSFLVDPRSRPLVLGLAAVITVALTIGLLWLLLEPGQGTGAEAAPEATSEEAVEGAVDPSVAGVTVTAAPVTTVAPTSLIPTSLAPTSLPATTFPPTTVPDTTPPTTVPPAGSVFDMAPATLVERWDALASPHSASLVSSEFSALEEGFAFDAGAFVRVQGSTQDGEVSRIVLLGDPSGTVADDREVLTALGLTLALVEPALPPDGRRELIATLGLDIEDPDLTGLDGELEYRDHRYALRWDPSLARIVFEIEPIA